MAGENGKSQAVYPVLRYQDAVGAIRFLKEAFGFQEHLVVPGPEDTIAHAQLRHGSGVVMLGSKRPEPEAFNEAGPAVTYTVVDDADEHHRRAVKAGAEIVLELQDHDYGSRGYTARDPEGNLWSFGTYRPASPA